MSAYRVNDAGFYGEFGGAYVPEILYKTVEDLRLAYQGIIAVSYTHLTLPTIYSV